MISEKKCDTSSVYYSAQRPCAGIFRHTQSMTYTYGLRRAARKGKAKKIKMKIYVSRSNRTIRHLKLKFNAGQDNSACNRLEY